MSTETAKHFVETQVQAMLVAEPTYFLVELKIKPVNQIQVFLDGDLGVTIEKCIQFNRSLYKKIEESGLFPAGNFSLEISSSGLDEPLKLLRQFEKNIGRLVEVTLVDGSQKSGRLMEVREDGIIVEETKGKAPGGRYAKKGKKQEIVSHCFLFNHIKTTKIQVVF